LHCSRGFFYGCCAHSVGLIRHYMCVVFRKAVFSIYSLQIHSYVKERRFCPK